MRGLLFIALIVGSFAQTTQEWGTCTFCNLVVSSLAGYASKTVNKQDLLNALTSVSNEVCPKMPAEFISADQCSSFISLYGPYTVDMIVSQTGTEQICSNLKLCSSDDSEAAYTVIFPTIDAQNQQVIYTASANDVSKVDQKFLYRIFLGNPSFLDEEDLTVELSENENADFNLFATNRNDISNAATCPAQSGSPCSVVAGKPGRGVWYYISVTATNFQYHNATQFTLTATVQNEVITNEGAYNAMHRRVFIFPIFLPIMLIAIVLCCCCVRRRKACKRTCQRKQESKEVQVAVDMQEMPQMPVMGYYYSPNGQMGYMPQYVQVPMQQMPQPVFIPVAQPE